MAAPGNMLGQLEQQHGVGSSRVQQGLGMLRIPMREAARAHTALVQEEQTPAVYLCPGGAGGQKGTGGDGCSLALLARLWGGSRWGPGWGCGGHLCGGAVRGSLRATRFCRAAELGAAGSTEIQLHKEEMQRSARRRVQPAACPSAQVAGYGGAVAWAGFACFQTCKTPEALSTLMRCFDRI